MAESDASPDSWIIKKLTEFRSAKLVGGGVVSKTTQVALGVIGVLGIAAWQMSDNWVKDVGLLFIALIVVGGAGLWVFATHRFAAANPAQAALEGLDLLQWQKFEAKTKQSGRLVVSPPISDPSQPAPAIDQIEGPARDG